MAINFVTSLDSDPIPVATAASNPNDRSSGSAPPLPLSYLTCKPLLDSIGNGYDVA